LERSSIPAARKRAKEWRRRKGGLSLVDRGGYWHIHGTVHAQGRSVRIRQGLGLQATPENREEAEGERLRIEREAMGELRGEQGSSPAISIAAEQYLMQPRKRPLGATTVLYLKQIVKKFGLRRLVDVREIEWTQWIDERCRGLKPESRERIINTALAFLNWCARKPRRWGTVPTFDRDKEARNPRHRARRAVSDLRPDLVEFLLSHAAPHLVPQLWTEWSTGARVSSILKVKLADVILAEGREQIIFRDTKNGSDVTAVLHPRAAQAIRDYLPIRGRLHDREGPLFLTDRGRPYTEDIAGVRNKSALNGMKRRARKALRQGAFVEASVLRKRGQHEAVTELIARVRADHRLLGRITQHWFRHMLATRFRGDIKSAMAQGG
jgi:site-specific recombinase XerD